VDVATENMLYILALTIAKNQVEVVEHWERCCEEALQQGNMIGLCSTKNSRTI
jgi:hypothetical protein